MAEHTQPIQIDAMILQQYVDALGSIGWQAEGGIIRPVYSAAWVQAREQVAAWMRAAGLEVRGDAVGNLFGRLSGRDDSRTILTGSHLDTVPLGGKFDGALFNYDAIPLRGALVPLPGAALALLPLRSYAVDNRRRHGDR